jgi:hypothetical protein
MKRRKPYLPVIRLSAFLTIRVLCSEIHMTLKISKLLATLVVEIVYLEVGV